MAETTTDDWYSEATATFGDRLAAAREAAHLTQQEIASRLGVRLKTIEAWENDTAEPRANRLGMLAGILNVTLRWLLTGEGGDVPEPAPEDLPEAQADILREMRALQSELHRSAERLARLEKRLRRSLAE